MIGDWSDTSNITVQRRIIGTVSFASLIGALDMSIVNISVPAIVRDWQIPIGLGSLVIISYLLTLTVLILIMGKLADRYGFRNIFLSGFLIFGIGSALCGFAPDIYILIGSRMIQATGAAMLSAVSPAIITRYLPDSARGKSLGYLIACSAVGYALGPGIGGMLAEYFSWRWIFYINLPIVIGGLVLGYYIIPKDSRHGALKKFDFLNASLFAVFLGGILASFAFYQVPGTPDSVLLALFLTGIAAGILFLIRDRKTHDPLFFTPLIKNSNFILGLITCFIITALFSGVTYLMPLYLVNSRHLDHFLAGLIMTVPALISMFMAPASGSLADRYGSPVISAVSIGLAALGFLLICTFNPMTAIAVIIAAMIITRVSTAAFFGPNGRLIMGNCTEDTIGIGSGMMMAVRHAGLVCGIALFQSVFAIRMYFEGIPRDGTPLVPRLTPALSVLGYQAVYLTAFVLCVLVVILCLISRDGPHPQSTSEEFEDTNPLM